MLAVLYFSVEIHCVRMKRGRTYLITTPPSPQRTRALKHLPTDLIHAPGLSSKTDTDCLEGSLLCLHLDYPQHLNTNGRSEAGAQLLHLHISVGREFTRGKYWTKSIILKNDRKQSWSVHSGNAYRELAPKCQNKTVNDYKGVWACLLPWFSSPIHFSVWERMLKAKVLSIHPSIW